MGNVRTEHIKRTARKLMERFPDKFTKDFAYNKKLVDDYLDSSSTKLRNKIAGYITRLVVIELRFGTTSREDS